MTATLHQFVPTLDPGAVGTHILEIQRTLHDAGWQSEIFFEHSRSPYEGRGRPFNDYGRSVRAHAEDVLVYHAAIGSRVADWLLQEAPRAQLVVDYHNVTPATWFLGWEPDLAYGLGWGRGQLRQLARRCRIGLADSAYNAAELRDAGFRRTEVLPILVDPTALGAQLDLGVARRLAERKEDDGGGRDWLFVGRIAPNKCQHHVVAAFSTYKEVYDHRARLYLVGGDSSPVYAEAVRGYAAELGIGSSVELTGSVSPGVLAAHYQSADIFVCLSEHEGFCVPLLEAWHHHLPVVAYAAAAVPETLGTGGLLLADKRPTVVAASVHRVVTDPVLSAQLVSGGDARLAEFDLARTRRRLLDLAAGLAA